VVSLTVVHTQYVEMLGLVAMPEYPVVVAALDAAVDRSPVYPSVADRVQVPELLPDLDFLSSDDPDERAARGGCTFIEEFVQQANHNFTGYRELDHGKGVIRQVSWAKVSEKPGDNGVSDGAGTKLVTLRLGQRIN
jgi:hypothetical protein